MTGPSTLPNGNADRLSAAACERAARLAGELDLDRLIANLEACWHSAQTTGAVASSDRRVSRRVTLAELPRDLRVSAGGEHIVLVEISGTGALVETAQRLSPGRTLDVFIRCHQQRRAVRATVIRSEVQAISPQPVYRAALRFDDELRFPEDAG